ncbi:AfsR/SARP family transcriptional regulator [Actinomycetes bacterium KLBMP 9797]
MRFGVLGPLRASLDGGADVPLRSRHERALLALLLAAEGHTVPLDVVVEALWPHRPPASHRSNLQTYVSRLRDRLPGVAIDHRGGGYRLPLAPDRLDLTVFRRAVAAGRAATDPLVAARHFRHGLGQWRGQPLADVPAAPLEAYARQWEAERLDAVEDHLDAELAAGERLPEVLAELPGLVAAHPLRERLHGQLMVALARAGRRAEALAAYQRARTTLVDELGVEPGDQLRRLHHTVLRGDPVAAPAAWRAVCQLPAAPAGFVGRADLRDRLAALLAPGPAVPVVVLSGQPGVGASALAVVAAHDARPAFPDGQLHAHLGDRDPAAVLADLLGSLGAAIPDGVAARAAAWRATVADRRVLVLLDGAADPDQVRPLLPGTPGSAALVTARTRLSGLIDAVHLVVPPLTAVEAGQLLGYAVGADRLAQEPVSAARIVAACGNVPLAVRIAGTRLAGRPWRLRELADRLDDETHRLDELAAVRDALAPRVASLSAPARDALARLARLGPVTLAPWLVQGRAPSHRFTHRKGPFPTLVDELVEAGLLEPVEGVRYRLPELVRVYARSLPAPAGVTSLVAAQAAAAAAGLPRTLTWFRPAGPAGDPFPWFDAELPLLLSVVDAGGSATPALAESLAPYLWARGRWAELRTVLRAARRTAAAGSAAGARVEFLAGVLSLVHGELGEAAAGFARAGAAFDRLGDRHGLACVLSDQAVLLGYQNRYEESALAAGRAVALFRAAADPVAAVLAAPAHAAALRGLGRLDEALDVDVTAVAEARREGAAELVVARCLNSLALTRLVRGEPALAYPAAREAVERLRGVGDRYVLLAALRHRASAAAGLGRRGEAVRLLEESHGLAVALGDRVWATGLERDLAVSWIGDGRADAAVPVLRRCLQTYDDLDIRSAKPATLAMLARAYDALGDPAAAEDARHGADACSDRTPALSQLILRLADVSPSP